MIRIRMMVIGVSDSIKMMLVLAHMRNDAHRYRKAVIRDKGHRVIDRKLRKEIRAYAKRRFGSKRYWAWLAYYTEVRGEFREGWIPAEYFRFNVVPRLNPEPALHADFKTFDYQLFGDFSVKPLFLFISGMYYTPDLKYVHPDEAVSQIQAYKDEIVIKQDAGWGGIKVRVVHGSEFKPEDLKKGNSYVIQPYVKQHKNLSDLYPHSVNTLRVTTFLKKDGTACVKFTYLRFGGDGSRIDNITSGGDFLYVDLDGTPATNTVHPYHLGTSTGERHKNTGFLYADLEIPSFHRALERCMEAHLKFPYARMVAWDVCINTEGEPKLLEWNLGNPDFYPGEIKEGPLWPDDSEF